MNIQIENEHTLNVLNDSIIDRFEFGSKIYGLNTDKSDIDDIVVIKQNDFFANSFLWEHHTIQRASEERDTIYTTLQLLVRNLVTGDSTAYFEVLHSDQCKGTVLEFLQERRDWFYNFSTIRAFIGYARRDIKHATDSGKRFSHALRCFYSALMLYKDNFYSNDLRDYDANAYQYIKSLKDETHGMSNKELHQEIKRFKLMIDSLRSEVSQSFNSDRRTLNRYMEPARLAEIDRYVIDINKKHFYDADLDDVVINDLYEALEYGIQY